MILAAGFGTRLAPLTETVPKTLVPVGGRAMLAHAIEAVKRAGATEIVVNVHHHAGQVEEHVRMTDYGVPVTVVKEEVILGTGGGILNARALLDGDEPFLVHNVDIISTFDLPRLTERWRRARPFAMLAVNQRPTSRAVVFDPAMKFLGKEVWMDDGWVFPDRSLRFGFCGIHLISPEIFLLGYPNGFSDVFEIYRLAMERGSRIDGVQFNGDWWDLGSVKRIEAFEQSDMDPDIGE